MRHIFSKRLFTSLFSAIFGSIVAGAIILGGIVRIEEQRSAEIRADQARLSKLIYDTQEIVCLANIVHHEARGEILGVRELVGKTVLAIVDDRTWKAPKSVCALAKVRGFFSNIKYIEEDRSHDRLWAAIREHMHEVYFGPRTLPRGWGCVRAFRDSDDYLEKLGPRSLAQLGFTVEAKGLKYFAKHRVPVATRGNVTFYAPRGGCDNPTATT